MHSNDTIAQGMSQYASVQCNLVPQSQYPFIFTVRLDEEFEDKDLQAQILQEQEWEEADKNIQLASLLKYQNDSGVKEEKKLSELSQTNARQNDADSTYKPSAILTVDDIDDEPELAPLNEQS